MLHSGKWASIHVFDTTFSADLTIMEESAELIHRIVQTKVNHADVYQLLPGLGKIRRGVRPGFPPQFINL